MANEHPYNSRLHPEDAPVILAKFKQCLELLGGELSTDSDILIRLQDHAYELGRARGLHDAWGEKKEGGQ